MTVSYLSLYRKWRSQKFSEIVGQEHVVSTLQNALKLNRIFHAYLYSGPRGTGKTSMAKIFAKALNCTEGITPEPCNKCYMCSHITTGFAPDVMEIDAASNRGIDEIRDLREKVKFAPTQARYKVYIIDEAHMLTTEAFNALLKTLEEPPSHVVFILATTELHRMPATIISRCQCFDFRRLPLPKIVKQLKKIADTEKIKINDQALALIAKNAGGSLRDAVSILDQVSSFVDETVTPKEISAVLGTVEQEILFQFADVISDNNVEAGLELIEQVVYEGKDFYQLTCSLIEHFRHLLIRKNCTNVTRLIDLSEDDLIKLSRQAGKFDLISLVRIIKAFNELKNEVKWSGQARILFEVGLLKLIKPEIDPELEGLKQRLGFLEERLKIASFISVESSPSPDLIIQSEEETEPEEEIHEGTEKFPLEEAETIGEPSLSKLKDKWDIFLDLVKKKKSPIYSQVKAGHLIDFKNNELIIGFSEEESFYRDNLAKKENTRIIEEALEELFPNTKTYVTLLVNPKQREKNTPSVPEKTTDHTSSEEETDFGELELSQILLDIFPGSKVIGDIPKKQL